MLKKTLIVVHRYAGIPLALMLVVWFVTGIVMMYAGGMPQLGAYERLEKLDAIDFGAVRVTPAAAAAEIGGELIAGTPVLLTVLERPAYRFGTGRDTITVFADTGEVLDELAIDEARAVAARFLGAGGGDLEFVRKLVQVDQWTLTLRDALPLLQFNLSDSAGTRVYVAPHTADVRLVTTQRSRALAWLGTIPHWLYFTPLRSNQPLWYWTVVWLAAAGCVLATIGLVLGVWQLTRSGRPKAAQSAPRALPATPYRGWMRWHHVLGLFFGLFALTWAFSGLLSMEPFAWTNAAGLSVPRDALTGGPVELTRYGTFNEQAWANALGESRPKEIEFLRIHGDHYYAVRFTQTVAGLDGPRERLHQPYYIRGRNEHGRLLVATDSLHVRSEPFTGQEILARLQKSVTRAAIVETQLLGAYDSYYYSRNRQAPLPVLRVKFDDPLETWVYVDTATSQPVAEIHRLARLERWLYNGLHSLDFAFWYDKRPLWDIGVIVLSLGALGTTLIGLLLGVQRLRRATARGWRRLAGRRAAT